MNDGLDDLEREIIAIGFLRREATAKHLSGIVRFQCGPYQAIASHVVGAMRDGHIVAEAFLSLDPELRDLANIARAEHQDQDTDNERLDLVVRLHAVLAEYIGKERRNARC